MMKNKNISIEQLTSFEISQFLSDKTKKNGLILPIGCTEQHGRYLPTGCDTIIAKKSAENLAENLQKNNNYKALVMPEIAYTPSPGSEYTSGTLSVSFELLGNLLKEVIKAAIAGGDWDFLVILNSHAHNHGRVIETSIAGISGELGRKIPIVVINIYDFINITSSEIKNPGSHAGEFEIALYHYYYPKYEFPDIMVNKSKILERPKNIFGLDVMKRSYDGIISNELPDIKLTIKKANKIGEKIDIEVQKTLQDNLDKYFEQWVDFDLLKTSKY